ncbi:MAG TPA: AfsR/SARP family transcriptional regulator, partial [Kribbella sp.]|nr:AfsR/SARP family transcriptional regulator [Kribbella sp.]
AVEPDALDVLSSLTDAVQAALDLHDAAGHGESGLDRLAAALADRELLLVLDNCEHVVEHAAELTDRLLAAASRVRVLATSREPLGLAGEVVWNVPTLDIPAVAADLATLGESTAVQLFVARAAAADRRFKLDDDSASAVSVLCRRLDGIPLALELAATRVRALGVQGLVARLDDRFRLLATGHRGAAPRQQTLMAMIDWSWELLTPTEQTVLRRLAVHADGCTAEAAELVCAAEDLPAEDVLDVLMRLVDRSLVVPVHGADVPRYRLLESVAAYCVEKLHEAKEFEPIRQRHHRYYTEFAERARPDLYGPDQKRRLQQLDDEAGNLRSALDGAVADGDAELAFRLVDALAWYWFLRGRLVEARRSMETVLALDDEVPVELRAGVEAWRAGFTFLQGDHQAIAYSDAALRRYDEVDDSAGRARAEWFLGLAGADTGDLAKSLALLERALETFRRNSDQWGVAAVLGARAKHAHVRFDLAALEADALESARLFREIGDRWGLLQATGWLGAHAELTGQYERAAELHRDALRMAEELGLWPEVAGELGWLSWIALGQGEYAKAREYSEQALRLATEHGHRSSQVLAEIVRGFAARRTGDLALAEKQLGDLIDAARQQDEPVLYLSMVLEELGFTLELRGDYEAARALHAEAFLASREHESRRGMVWALEGLAGDLPGSPEVAAQLLGLAATTRETEAMLVTQAESGDIVRVTAAVREALGDDEYAAAFARGAELSLEEAFALGAGQSSPG